ncbi:RNA-binding domain-containing protein [Artomyces pyxidatus]|uniref:RNA-binding domain-containing protein n=1 Tax=Artomyces pyxidatus TaxID=48021 RepID=A0ACB8TG04_9AGAM|nr:RNA-binding domain-containing protein [Artomyces pyxidatus]
MAPLTEEKTEGLQDVAEGKARSKRRKVDKADTVGASSVSPKKAEGVLTPRKSALKVTKVPSPVPEPEVPESDEDSDAPVQADGSSDEEDVHLHGFSTDEDSSDDDMDGDVDGFDVELLPTIAKDDATVKRKLARAKREPTVDRGVVCLSRIPHGFYEQQMKAYFSQFGEVTRLRLSRNKKTGRSKHYGFIEFDSSSVAKIVAETMDNYLLMGHILSCKLIPKDDVHPELWVGANRKWRAVPMDRVARVKHNKPRTVSEQLTVEKRLVKRQEARKRKLAEQGIKYDFDAVAYKRKPMVQQP